MKLSYQKCNNIIIMPLSKLIKIYDLIPGKRYMIDIQWNLTNDLRIPNSNYMIGTFLASNYIRGRTYSYDTGLQVLLSRSRLETEFNIDGNKTIVSSVNKFYEVLTPPKDIIEKAHKIFTLHLPNDIKKYICKYIEFTKDLYYRPRPTYYC